VKSLLLEREREREGERVVVGVLTIHLLLRILWLEKAGGKEATFPPEINRRPSRHFFSEVSRGLK